MCQLGFHYMTSVDIVNVATKPKGKKGMIESALQHSVATYVDYIGQRDFDCSDIAPARKVLTAVRNCKHFSLVSNHYRLWCDQIVNRLTLFLCNNNTYLLIRVFALK